MPYISKDQVKIKRKALKAALPQYKLSITTENYSGIKVALMKGPVDFGISYKPLSPWIDYNQSRFNEATQRMENQPEIAKLMAIIMPILNDGLGEGYDDGDYGHVPDYYTWVQIGKWDQSYVCTQDNINKTLTN